MRNSYKLETTVRSLLTSASSCALTIMLIVALTSADAGASEPKKFGIESFAMETIESTEIVPVGGNQFRFVNKPYVFTQAGGHPWGLTAKARLDSEEIENKGGIVLTAPVHDPKDIVGNLPPGLFGNPTATPRCSLSLVTSGTAQCPVDTQVGTYRIVWLGGKEGVAPIVNVTPEAGQSAEFALENDAKVIIPLLTAHLIHTKAGYGITVVSSQIPVVELVEFELTFWGVPADPSHDAMRNRFCNSAAPGEVVHCSGGGVSSGLPEIPFISMPTSCSAGIEMATLRADSWPEPGKVSGGEYEGYVEKSATMPGVTGCDLLEFNPSIEVRPDTVLADSPVSLGVKIQVPQPESPGVNVTPHLRNAVVTLPEGMSVSPGIVDGIQACHASGDEGINFEGPLSEEVGPSGELQLAPGRCPDASIVGEAEAITPLLEKPVEGHVYLASPGCGGITQPPCTEADVVDGNLYRLYLELGGTGELANAGVNIKAEGKVEVNPATGQLTTVFENNPQTPFSELKVRLNGGPRAPLDNPAVCGPAVTTTDFTPWSAPGITPQGLSMPGTPDATPSSYFNVGGCTSPSGLTPGFLAGTVTPQAGKFSSFTMDLSRKDREQYVKGIQVHTPPGLLGILANVPLCGEQQAESGTCSSSSKIGTTRVASGAGSHPFEIEGDVYLTGPYRGQPFGLSIVVHVVAGPFNLGIVVVRARIAVDRQSSTLTVTTDESGSHAVPQIVFGVPVRLQRITVNIDRPNFMFNPTNCAAEHVTATVSGSQDAVASVSSPFAVGGCKSLAFKPKFSVFTNGHTSRTNGASLDVRLSYPKGALGNDSNIARVKVSLPKQLPSRLTTLQQACPAGVFEVNPASCPSGSVVGVVRASTPLLPVGLSGPVYFVSHGGEAFPSLIIVLQGDRVRVDLTGTTFISKAGITSSTFKTVPDVPVNTFELYLPQGKGSALAANGNLCRQAAKLVMPTLFVAQNGAQLKQSTKIAATGCAARKPRRAKRARATRHDGRAGR